MIFDALGVMVLPGVAYLFPNWRILHLVLFGPLLLIVVLSYWLVSFFALCQILLNCRYGIFNTLDMCQASPRVSSLAHDSGQEGRGTESAHEGSQSEWEEDT